MITYQDGRAGIALEGVAVAVAADPSSPWIPVPKDLAIRGLALYALCSAGTATVRPDLYTCVPGASDEEWLITQAPGTSVFGGSMEKYMVGWFPVGDLLTATGSEFDHHVQAPVPAIWKVKAVVAGTGTSTFKVHYEYFL